MNEECNGQSVSLVREHWHLILVFFFLFTFSIFEAPWLQTFIFILLMQNGESALIHFLLFVLAEKDKVTKNRAKAMAS
jgi:hypothetical protein